MCSFKLSENMKKLSLIKSYVQNKENRNCRIPLDFELSAVFECNMHSNVCY